jgi:carboxyl-terminal processing protease
MAVPTRVLAAALSLTLVAACCPPAVADVSSSASPPAFVSESRGALAERFETAWSLVAERYWDLSRLPVDWDEVGERYRARLDGIDDADGLYRLLEEMYDEIGDDHSVFVPPARVAEIRDAYGNMPCVAVFGSSAGFVPIGAPSVMASLATAPLHVALGVVGGQGLPEDTESIGHVEYGMTAATSDDGSPIGYIRLPDLASEGVAGAVRLAVDRLQADGATGLVLDMRGNPGGRLVTMMQVAGVFTGGFLWRAIMSWTLPLPYPAIGQPATDLPLAVLIDGGVNSAAEGLAGALQAKGRATLFGSTTAGNVEAVLPFCLRDGSQAWIATGVLAPLVGATWEGRGVEPDVVVESHQPASSGEDPVLAAALDTLARGSDQQ